MPPKNKTTTLESKPLDWFRPYDQNARTHDSAQIARLVEVIRQQGFRDPVECTPTGEIIAGHGRHMAAVALDLESVPVLIHHDMTEAQVRAYRIANNRIAELSGWDRLSLAKEIRQLESMPDLEAPMELGFDSAYLELLARELDGAPPPGPASEGTDQRGLGTPVIAYNLVFDTGDQQDKWFEFIRHLRSIYPGGDLTVAAMLTEYITQSMSEDRAGA